MVVVVVVVVVNIIKFVFYKCRFSVITKHLNFTAKSWWIKIFVMS